MDEKYINLFQELARVTSISAEQVMDYDVEKNDKEGFATAQMMRDNYSELHDRIGEAGDAYTLTKSDAAKLAVGAIILISQLQDKIKALKNAVDGYQNELLPKLQDIVDNAENDEVAAQMANEKFIIKEEK